MIFNVNIINKLTLKGWNGKLKLKRTNVCKEKGGVMMVSKAFFDEDVVLKNATDGAEFCYAFF